MSHFAKLSKAIVTDVDAFLEACAKLGMIQVSRNVDMKAWDSEDKPVRVDVFAQIPGCQYGIGLIKNATGRYDMISDWSLTGSYLNGSITSKLPPGFPGKDGPGGTAFAACEALRGLVLRDVTQHTIARRYRRQGFRVQFTEDAERNITMKLTRSR